MRGAALAVSRRTDDGNGPNTVDDDVAVPVMSSQFSAALLNLPAAWSEVVTLTNRARLSEILTPLVDALPRQAEPATPVIAPGADTIHDRRRSLYAFARRLVYAEGSNESSFLTTEALRTLAETHRTELPIAVVLGSKGAGKTFTYLQLCQRPDWASFAEAVEVTGTELRAPTVPVLASANLDESNQSIIERRREALARELTGEAPAGFQDLHQLIDEALTRDLANFEWRRIWLTCLALSIGLKVTPETVENALTDFARRHSVVFVLDGLEDRFLTFAENVREQQALRALLVDCPDWLRTLRGRPLGLVTFVRRDLARVSISQNVAQFEARYEKYALRWNRKEALRLATWICQQGNALARTGDDVRTAKSDQLSRLMVEIWGEKMGSAKSKEARSEVWFFAALSDFQQQLQARDIVSFLSIAARESVGADARWSDRVLAPTAMRNALPECSENKISEIREENGPVAELLDHLRNLPVESRSLPFRIDDVGLTAKQIDLLRTNGVVFQEGDQYWIPEIFRHGLGFKGQRRPRVIAVANLVRRRNDVSG